MTTDEDFRDMANAAYNADPLWTDQPIGDGTKIPPTDPRYIVVEEPVCDSVTGFQAITMAPLLPDGKPDPDPKHLFVSFAGTNPAHRADLNADAQTVIAGKVSATQVEQALKYAKQVQAKYPDADFTAVGHSLGGYLAMLVAAERRWSCTSFNGPDPFEQLSPQGKKWVKELIASDPGAFRNFVNEWDAIGNSHGNGTGAAVYVKGKPFQGLLGDHNLSSGFSFDDTGRIEGAGVPARNGYQIMENLLHGVPPMLREPLAGLGAGAMAALQVPVIGEGVGRSVSTVMVMIDTLAATSLASTVYSAADLLTSIKSVNESLIPRMQLELTEAKILAYTIPYLTEADIENCVAVEGLRVEDNIDQHAVQAVNRRIDDHLETIHTLYDGITKAVLNAGEQDARWAAAFGSR